MLAGISKVYPEAWITFPAAGADYYIGEPEHRIGDTRVPCRPVYVCRRTAEDRQLGRGGVLIFALATTLTEYPAKGVRRYRQRDEIENRIRELQSSVAAGQRPSTNFERNAACGRIASSLSDNPGIGLARAELPMQRITIETLRWYVLAVEGRLVTSSCRWYLQLVREVRAEMERRRAIRHRRFSPAQLLPDGYPPTHTRRHANPRTDILNGE